MNLQVIAYLRSSKCLPALSNRNLGEASLSDWVGAVAGKVEDKLTGEK